MKTENTCPHKNLYTDVYSSIIHSSQKREQPKCPLVDEWLNHMQYSHIILFGQEKKWNATTWMDFENIMQSEKSQTDKDTYYMIPFIWKS